MAGQLRKVVLVDGVRIPFATSGTAYKSLMAHDLGRMALSALLTRTGLIPSSIDRIIMGTVIQESKTSNVARESALGAGIPYSVPAHTVTMACISSNQAISSGMDLIRAGQAEIVVASGTETMSDVPIRFSRPIRERLIAASKVKHPAGYLKLLSGLGLKDLAPEAPAIAEFSTGETMGRSADRLAAAFGVTRREQDELALRSHRLAAEALKNGLLKEELATVRPAPKFEPFEGTLFQSLFLCSLFFVLRSSSSFTSSFLLCFLFTVFLTLLIPLTTASPYPRYSSFVIGNSGQWGARRLNDGEDVLTETSLH
jgi:acetyl-CoA acetyltransferase family protein